MIQALFNEDRRKELLGAIRTGKPIEFRGKEPKVEDNALSIPDKEAYFEGPLSIGEGQRLGGFEFIYNGPSASERYIAMGIRSGDGLAETRTLPVGKETVIDFAADGTRVRITPLASDKSVMQARIDLEPMFAEND